MTALEPTPVALANSHIKCYLTDGATSYEHCEDLDCTVDNQGSAGCGRIACPNCGVGGINLTAPDGFDGDQLIRCTCGHAWLRREDSGEGPIAQDLQRRLGRSRS